MKPVDRSEILPLGEYEAIRERFRARIIGEKKHRRVPLGEDVTVVFENHDTVLLQIQEMLRTERITKEAAIAHEIETYNALVPGEDQLSMTLFVEINDKEPREKALTERAGMESHVGLEVDGERLMAVAGAREGADPARTTAVQYYLVDLSNDKADALRRGDVKEVSLFIDHPACKVRSVLPSETVGQLASDLSWD